MAEARAEDGGSTASSRGGRGPLVLCDVHLRFGGLAVLDGVSFEVHPGELLALIGPNGAGKTSVLNCITQLYRPSAGTIDFEGEPLTGLAAHRVAERGIARTFQLGGLFAHLTVLENLLVGRHRRFDSNVILDGLAWGRARRSEVAQRAAAEEMIELFELERHRDAPVSKLPFGVQKVVGFARALAMEPRLLLLDEPSAGLNREAREDLARFILRIKHERGLAMVWVEHDMQMVADLADRIVVMDYGACIADGPPQQVLADPRVVEIYLGSRRN